MTDVFGWSHETWLLLYTLLAVVGLIVLIARFKVNSFVALILASLFVGLCCGMELPKIATAFQAGVGNVLGLIAIVIGLGTILGKMLAESGGADMIASRLIEWLGPKRLHWAIMLIGFVIGIPVFFSVGLVLLIPLVFTTARQAKMPLLYLGIPLVAGLSVVHGLVPPHPGPMAAIGLLKADVGRTILYSLLIGLPVAIVAGPIFGRFVAARFPMPPAGAMVDQLTHATKRTRSAGFGMTILTILLPVVLMLLSSLADVVLAPGTALRQAANFVGSPLVALVVAVLFSFYSFGHACGFNSEQILKFSTDCLGPVAGVLLVVGAGGGFNGVLVASGVGQAIAGLVSSSPVSPMVLAWLAAALIRVATGSATVAITTAAGILAPAVTNIPGLNVELLVVAMGAGSLILSHVNDGGFWLVKEYLNLSVPQMLQTWTVMETLISILALLIILAIDFVI